MLPSTNVVLEEEIDKKFEPSEEALVEYARWLGMRLPEHNDLLWIAREGLKAPLPDHWKPCWTEDDEIYYFNFESGESVWEHPCDEYYRKLYVEMVSKKSSNFQQHRALDSASCLQTTSVLEQNNMFKRHERPSFGSSGPEVQSPEPVSLARQLNWKPPYAASSSYNLNTPMHHSQRQDSPSQSLVHTIADPHATGVRGLSASPRDQTWDMHVNPTSHPHSASLSPFTASILPIQTHRYATATSEINGVVTATACGYSPWEALQESIIAAKQSGGSASKASMYQDEKPSSTNAEIRALQMQARQDLHSQVNPPPTLPFHLRMFHPFSSDLAPL